MTQDSASNDIDRMMRDIEDKSCAHTCVPDPLVPPLLPANRYPEDALGALKDVALAVQRKTEAPLAIAAQTVLGVVSICAQGHVDVKLRHGATKPTSLFLMTIAESGERKSACDSIALEPVREIERCLFEAYQEALSNYERKKAIWDKQRQALLKKIGDHTEKGETEKISAVEQQLEELGRGPDAPELPMVMVSDPTLEGLIKLFKESRPSLGVFNDEGGTFIGGHAMNKDNRMKAISGLSRLWDGSKTDRVRVGESPSVVFARRLSMHLLVQPVVASDLLTDSIVRGQGILARFLMTYPASNIGFRRNLDMPASAEDEEAIESFGEQVKALLKRELPRRNGIGPELEPRVLPLSEGATNVMREFGQSVERSQRQDGWYYDIRPFASKAEEIATRLAGLLCFYRDQAAVEISEADARNATSLMHFYLEEASRLTTSAPISLDYQAAQDVVDWIVSKWPHGKISIADVLQKGPHKHRDMKKLTRVFKILEERGYLVRMNDPDEIDGKRRRKVWEIHLSVRMR